MRVAATRLIACIIWLTFVIGGAGLYAFVLTGGTSVLLTGFAGLIVSMSLAAEDLNVCSVAGHCYEPEAERHGYYECERCEYVGYEPAQTVCERTRSWRSWRRWRLRCWFDRVVVYRWYRVRCQHCGCWFGRHDYDKDDHIPF